MRPKQPVLLAVAVLVAVTSAAQFGPASSVLPVTRKLDDAGENETIPNSFPTSSKAVDTGTTDEEERGLNTLVLKLKYKVWLFNGNTPLMALDKLQTAGVPLNEKTMMSWFKYSLKYAAVQGEDNVAASYTNIFKAMTKRVPEEEVPLLLVAMMKDPKLDKLFRTFQARQYKTWKGQGWSSNDVKKVLRVQTLGKTLDELKKDNAYLFWQGYVRELAKK